MTRRRVTLAEQEIVDEIRRRGSVQCSTGAYRTGRGVEAPHGRGTAIKPVQAPMLWAPCWCETYERWVTADDIAAGHTWQCANRDCHPPGEPRPTYHEFDPEIAIHYDPPGTCRRNPTEAVTARRLFTDRGVFRPRPRPEIAQPSRPAPRPLTQADYPLDREFAAAIEFTGANRHEVLATILRAAAQAGIEGNFRTLIVWYAYLINDGEPFAFDDGVPITQG